MCCAGSIYQTTPIFQWERALPRYGGVGLLVHFVKHKSKEFIFSAQRHLFSSYIYSTSGTISFPFRATFRKWFPKYWMRGNRLKYLSSDVVGLATGGLTLLFGDSFNFKVASATLTLFFQKAVFVGGSLFAKAGSMAASGSKQHLSSPKLR